MNRALLTGATGAIGPPLLTHLLGCGYQVCALVRQNVPAGLLPAGITVIRGDVTDRSTIDKAVAGVDVVFHLAAKLHINDPSPGLKREYQRVNVEGTRCLAEAARAAGVKRFVFFSTINVYGPGGLGQFLNEGSPLHPDSFYAETKAQAENIAFAALPAVVLRLAAVYGPNMKGNYLRLLEALRRRRFAFVGDGLNRRTLVHVQDVCSAAILAATHPAAPGNIYNVTDGSVHSLEQIVQAMCITLNRNPPRLRLPANVVRRLAGIIEAAAHCLLRKRVPVRAAVAKLTEDTAVSGTRIIDELGWQPQYDLFRGWCDTIRGTGRLERENCFFPSLRI